MIAKPDKERRGEEISRHISFEDMEAKTLNKILANAIQHYIEKNNTSSKVCLFRECMGGLI